MSSSLLDPEVVTSQSRISNINMEKSSYFKPQRFDQTIYLQELSITRFPKLILGEVVIMTPQRDDGRIASVQLQLEESEFFITPFHSHITQAKDHEGGMVELLLHNRCLFQPHSVMIPPSIVDRRKNISPLNQKSFMEEFRKETPGPPRLGIIEVFHWHNFGRYILEALLGTRGDELKEAVWNLLDKGKIAIMDGDEEESEVLVDLKHRTIADVKKALETYGEKPEVIVQVNGASH